MSRANVIGLGLVGGSIAIGLRSRGWTVSGEDLSAARVDEAVARGCIDSRGLDPDAAITFVAVPVLAAQDAVERALKQTAGVVTDVGSVKRALCAAIDDDRFVGGHPMAGSELEGLDGADADMFSGAVWVLTPTDTTAHTTIAAVASAVGALGAEMVAMAPAAPRRDGRRGQPRTASRCGEPHGTGRRWGRRTRRPTAARRRRFPGHDPHRQRAPGHLARHLRPEP